MRLFTSFYFVHNDSKLFWCRLLGGVVLLIRSKTTPPKSESIH